MRQAPDKRSNDGIQERRSLRRLFRAGMIVTLTSVSFAMYAQENFKKLKEFPMSGVSRISIDRLGDFYLTVGDGIIKKYDPEGNFMVEFANPGKDTTTLLEPWNPLRPFRYVRGKQQIELFDRFFELQQKIPVDPAWAVEPILACPGITNTFWVLDESDASLKLIDPKTKGVIREAAMRLPTSGHPNFTYMREYQNLLFLIDRNSGIMVINTVGTLVHKVEILHADYVGVLGEEFYYLDDHKLKFFDLYTEEKHEYEVDVLAKFVLVTDERMIVVKESSVEIREFKDQ